MKKILGLAVAVAFLFAATAVKAEEKKATDTTKAPAAVEKVNIEAKNKATGVKEEVKVTESTNKGIEKVTVKATEKAPGLNEKVTANASFNYADCQKKCAKNAECLKTCDVEKANFEKGTKAVAEKATEKKVETAKAVDTTKATETAKTVAPKTK